MTIEQGLDLYLRTDKSLMASISTTSNLSSSSVISQGAHTIDRETGSFITDGWVTGYTGYITDSGANNGALFTVTGTVTALSLTVIETLTMQTKAQAGACVLTRYSATRLHWMQAPEESTLPYVVYQTIDDTDLPIHFGNTDTGQARVQFSVVGETKAAKDIMFRIRTLIRGKSGQIGGSSGPTISQTEYGLLREQFNPDTMRYVFLADYRIWFAYA